MKKVILSMALATAVISANAQDMNSKRGTPILPEAKDWTIGIDARPIFGNVLNHDYEPNWNFTGNNPMIITFGMVKDETTTYRAKVRLGFGSTKRDSLYENPVTNATGDVTDTRKTSENNIAIGVGIQKNRGKGRLRGIYGVEAMIGLGGGKSTTDYGTTLSDTSGAGTVTRETESKNGSTFSVGIRAFLGAEYFFAPKMSVSGEFGWGLALRSTGEGEVTNESFGDNPATTGTVENTSYSTTTKTGKSSSFGIDTDNMGGSVVFHFYF